MPCPIVFSYFRSMRMRIGRVGAGGAAGQTGGLESESGTRALEQGPCGGEGHVDPGWRAGLRANCGHPPHRDAVQLANPTKLRISLHNLRLLISTNTMISAATLGSFASHCPFKFKEMHTCPLLEACSSILQRSGTQVGAGVKK
jgi:hypothetical protein